MQRRIIGPKHSNQRRFFRKIKGLPLDQSPTKENQQPRDSIFKSVLRNEFEGHAYFQPHSSSMFDQNERACMSQRRIDLRWKNGICEHDQSWVHGIRRLYNETRTKLFRRLPSVSFFVRGFHERRTILLMSAASGLTSWLIDVRDPGMPIHNPDSVSQRGHSLPDMRDDWLLIASAKNTLDERKRTNDKLQQALEELGASTEQIRKLQNGLQVVCARTKRIKVGEQWMTPDEFLRTQH